MKEKPLRDKSISKKNISLIVNYPLKDQIKKGNIDIIKVQLDNLLKEYEKVYLISLKDKSSSEDYNNIGLSDRVIIHPVRGYFKKAPWNSLFSLRYELKEVYNYLKEKDIVAIRAYATLMSGYIAVKVAKKLKVPSIVSVHVDQEIVEKDDGYPGFIIRVSSFLEKRILRRADMVPVISEYIRDYVRKLGVPESKIMTHPNFTYEDIFAPIQGKKMQKKIICACRLVPWKYPHKILEAMPSVLEKHKDAKAYFAGTGGMENEMKQAAKSLGVEDSVIFLGDLDHLKELPKLIAESDIFACGIAGFAIMEAMACGLPIVVGDYEWAREVIIDGETGYLVRSITNAKEYAERINHLFDNPDEITRIGKNNRAVALKRFSKTAFEKRELEMYRKAIEISSKNGN